jgi:hypothetical protein
MGIRENLVATAMDVDVVGRFCDRIVDYAASVPLADLEDQSPLLVSLHVGIVSA